jgi:hypothetical protein
MDRLIRPKSNSRSPKIVYNVNSENPESRGKTMQQRLISFWGWLSRPNRIRFILLALTALALLVPEASALAENATGGSG